MQNILDKGIILLFCCSFMTLHPTEDVLLVAFLVAIILSALSTFFAHKWVTKAEMVLYGGLCIGFPGFGIFLPFISYDCFLFKEWYCGILLILPYIKNFESYSTYDQAMLILFTLVAFLLEYRTSRLMNLKRDYNSFRDTSKEHHLILEHKNKMLMEKQDYEIHFATLSERNRIAREIHDNVGHMLSRSILQVGALLATYQEEELRGSLSDLKGTLSTAMDSIRESVHDLHDESIDLYQVIQELIREFRGCKVDLEYEIESNLDKNLKYCFIMILKEAFSNITKHSNATGISIIVREHPALYQLLIQDNGNSEATISDAGMGLDNMRTRAEELGGTFHASFGENGFRTFVSVPKKNDIK